MYHQKKDSQKRELDKAHFRARVHTRGGGHIMRQMYNKKALREQICKCTTLFYCVSYFINVHLFFYFL